MVAYPSRLPARFPEGTKYVVERQGGTFARYVEFPNGTRVSLPVHKALDAPARRLRGRRPTGRR